MKEGHFGFMMFKRMINKMTKGAVAIAALVLFAPNAAHACGAYPVGAATDGVVSFLSAGTNLPFVGDTTVQTAEAGTITYNSGDNTLYLCDGTAWKKMVAGAAGTSGQVQFNDTGAMGADAEFVYDAVNNQLVVGAASANGSAALEVSSTTRGFLPPRMTVAQRNTIASPTEGLMIFNTDDSKMEFFDGYLWRPFGAVALGGDGLSSGTAGISCKQILEDYGTGTALYWVDPDATGPVSAMQVYCDMTTDGGGWMLIARNNAPTTFTNFNKSWAEYKAGFGDVTVPTSLGWIGNDKMYQLTIGGRELAVRTNALTHYYDNFSVANEANNYRLSVTATASSNDAHSPFATNHSGYDFSTYDDDNDVYSAGTGNCAGDYAAGWWYSACYSMSFASSSSGYAYWRNNSTFYGFTWIEMWIR